MKLFKINISLLLTSLLVACSSGSDLRYLDSAVGENLALPPDLSRYELESSFDLPKEFSGDDESVRNKVPVLAKVKSLQVQSNGDFYWLSVDEPIDNLYQQVKNFWAFEGYRLVIDEPVIGVMQTEWILKEEGASQTDKGWFESLFSGEDLSASQDQFKTRLERNQAGEGSRIYITHRATEFVYVLQGSDRNQTGLETNDDNQWRFRQPEPELEVEMLSRLMVYLGLQKAGVEQKLANVKLFSPRAALHVDVEEQSPFLILNDTYHIAWNRVYHQLERMNFDIHSSDFKSGLSGEGVIVVNAAVEEDADNISGFSFFSTSAETEIIQIALILSEQSHEHTRVIIENDKGDIDTSPAGAEFLNLLFKQIK